MKMVFLGCIYIFLVVITLVGVPLNMNIPGISHSADRLTIISTHESMIQLMGKSKLSLHCQNNDRHVCVRPIDYSHLRTNLPVSLEACQSSEKIPNCDDLLMGLAFNSRDLLKIGLRL